MEKLGSYGQWRHLEQSRTMAKFGTVTEHRQLIFWEHSRKIVKLQQSRKMVKFGTVSQNGEIGTVTDHGDIWSSQGNG